MSGLKLASSRAAVCARRWADVIVTGIASAALAALALWWKPEALLWLERVPLTAWAAVAGLLLILGVRRGPGQLVALIDARHALVYPPLWAGVAGGLASAFVALGKLESVRKDLGLSASDALGSGALVLGLAALLPLFSSLVLSVVSCLKRPLAADSETQAGPESSHNALDIKSLRAWVTNDKAVESTTQDMFEHSRIAKRLAKRLALQDPPSQAVIGALGAGKTTLGHLLREQLAEEQPHIKLIRAELWPYESPRPAVKAVISALIEELSHHTNVFGLRGLPGSYADLVASTGSIPGALARFKRPVSDPIGSLSAIDEIATGLGLHLVIWVEDLERFAIGDPTKDSPETYEEAERLAPVRSLLYGLDRLRSVTVVTATTTLYRRFDLEKIARYVERIPALEAEEVRRVVCAFRREWAACDVIDPTGARARQEVGWEEMDDALLRAMVGNRPVTLADACIALCRTPRILKQALRRCEEICQQLAGEIDHDATLAMSILRESSPTGFAIVEQHIDAIRNRDTRRAMQQSSNPVDDLRERLASSSVSDADVDAIMLIVEKTVVESSLLQGFARWAHADYWHRFLAIPELRRVERDQDVLRAIVGSDDQSLVEYLRSERSSTVESFAHKISADRLIGLLVPLVQQNVHVSPKGWEERSRQPGLVPLWRTFLERHRMGELPSDVLLAEVLRAYEIAVPGNLTAAADLEHWLVVPSKDVPQLLPDELVQRAKKALRDSLLDHYMQSPEALATQLADAAPFILLWLCWGIDRVRADRINEAPFDRWPDFAKTVIEAARLNPAAMLPQIAAIVARQNREFRGPRTWEFVPERCQDLFGSETEVLQLFLDPPVTVAELPMVTAIQRAALVAQRESGDQEETAALPQEDEENDDSS